MQTKTFDTVEEANEFIAEMSTKDVALDAHLNSDKKYVVSWVENKKYIAQDGREFTDEVWITIDNKMIHVQDLEPEHAKNIIRMMLRNRRESMTRAKEIFSQIESSIADLLEDDVEPENETTPSYLH